MLSIKISLTRKTVGSTSLCLNDPCSGVSGLKKTCQTTMRITALGHGLEEETPFLEWGFTPMGFRRFEFHFDVNGETVEVDHYWTHGADSSCQRGRLAGSSLGATVWILACTSHYR